MRRRLEALGAVAAGAGVLVLAGLSVSRHRAFWSPDSGLRFVQVEALVRQGYRRVSIPYPGAPFDPGARYLPFSGWFLVRREGELHILYPPYFPALASLPYQVVGFPGLLLLPLAGVVAVLGTTASLLKTWTPLAVPAILSTPLSIYGLLFWDHAPAVGLCAGATALVPAAGLEKRSVPAFLAGVLAGLGLWLRTEMYLFALALVLAAWQVFARRVAARIVVGILVPALAVWALNLYLFGHPLGLKGEAAVGARVAEVRSAVGAVEEWTKRRLLVAYDLLVSTEQPHNGEHPERIPLSLAVSSTVVAGSVLLFWGVRSRDPIWVLAGAVVAILGPLSAAVTGQHLMGLLPTTPLVAILSLAARSPLPEVRFPLLTGALYTAAVLVSASVGGLQWGPRYLLPAVPLFAWAGLAALVHQSPSWPRGERAVHAALGILIIGGLVVQSAGMAGIHASVRSLATLSGEVERRSAPILVSGAEPVLRTLAPLYFRRVLLRVDGREALRDLVRALSRHRVREWTYIPFTGPRFDREQIERWSEAERWRFQVVRDEVLPMVFVAEAREYRALTAVRLITYRGWEP
ncbi:MAG: hypothetical protein QN193_10465 [Armatimonadota bacterium]|nr:hypothetical protein [Armatimonadota bacterium]MDR7571019.1 hypothetical protein [Armatimonadota bacterium]MDR7614447.1 hypothetical protein [Armatimonadota bacterium]